LPENKIQGVLSSYEIFELGGRNFSSNQVKAFMAGSQNKNYEQIPDDEIIQRITENEST